MYTILDAHVFKQRGAKDSTTSAGESHLIVGGSGTVPRPVFLPDQVPAWDNEGRMK